MIINPVIIESNNKHTADEVCQQWQLNAQQIKQFFQISERYLNYPYNSYYQIPCKITGTLKAYGIIWKFTIEGSATGFWQ